MEHHGSVYNLRATPKGYLASTRHLIRAGRERSPTLVFGQHQSQVNPESASHNEGLAHLGLIASERLLNLTGYNVEMKKQGPKKLFIE